MGVSSAIRLTVERVKRLMGRKRQPKKATYSQRVNAIIEFIEKLTIPSGKGVGGPVVLRPFQKKFINDVYGPLSKDGKRQVRRAILSIGRKNGKSFLLAALILVHLVGPEAILNGEIYSAANDREQASRVFKYAAQMLRLEPELMPYVKIVDSTKTIVCLMNGSVFRALSAEVGTKYGLNPTFCIYDELSQSRTRDLYDALDTSMAAREEPLFIVISTQSNDPQHILSQLIDDGLSGDDPSTVCHLYATPDDMEDVFTDKGAWELSNPALDDFRSLSELKTMADRALRMPTFESTFRNLYLNQRVNAESPLIPRIEWVACQGVVEYEDKERIYLGLDLSGKTDLTALVAVSDGEKDRVKSWFWKPADLIKEHERRDRAHYSLWVKQGFIESVPGRAIQYDYIAVKLGEISSKYTVVGLAFDRWRIDDLANALGKIGIDYYVEGKDKVVPGSLRMVPWGQGYQDMTPAVEAVEISIMDRRFIHDGNPCLTWNFANAIPISDAAGGRKLDKSKSRFRIDGATACVMAKGLKSRDLSVEEPASVYETRGVIII
jgi:phage terminase large subunit-like protein